MEFAPFKFKNIEEIKSECKKLGSNLCFSDNLDILNREVTIKGVTIPNSLVAHPMEGSDGNEDGSPGELSVRRNLKYARGGVGLVWFEAIAVEREGRASKHQLMLTEKNKESFAKLIREMKSEAKKANGDDFELFVMAQMTHSGRFSRPNGVLEPKIGCHDPYLDAKYKISPEAPLISDGELEELENKFITTALLAKEAGFDGVDIKACHKYLASELLGAFTREGKYGGSFENRTRFLLNIVEKVRKAVGTEYIIGSRLNVYDVIPYPYGFGVDKEDVLKFDPTEPIKLIGLLREKGVDIINVSMGTPYLNPHVNRPYDKGGYIPDENPLEGVLRMINGIGLLQKQFPDFPIVGTGYSWMREFSPNLAAGSIENGLCTLVGFGREGLAYPDFANDILKNCGLKKNKCCIACSKCSDLLRAGQHTGCVVRDSEIYAKIYIEKMK